MSLDALKALLIKAVKRNDAKMKMLDFDVKTKPIESLEDRLKVCIESNWS